jgi:hypothetical protein
MPSKSLSRIASNSSRERITSSVFRIPSGMNPLVIGLDTIHRGLFGLGMGPPFSTSIKINFDHLTII